jgi:SAM-dependent methyltransferase
MVRSATCFYNDIEGNEMPEGDKMTELIQEKAAKSAGTPAPVPVDLEAVKARQQVMWSSGDYAVIGTTLQLVGESLCEAVDLVAGSRVLDVACGSGNATLAAARRFARTTGVDYVPALLALGRERALAERQAIEFIEGDAERLPFGDAGFDTVLSVFGVMFAANQTRAADELLRVCKVGGKIGLASWTPEGFLGDLFRTMGKHVPPPAGVASPLRWGTDAGLAELFGARARVLRAERRHFVFRYRSSTHFIDTFRDYYGPTHLAFKALDAAGKTALNADLHALLERRDRGAGGLSISGEYLEVVLERAQ